MKEELTSAEKSKVFGMYLPCTVLCGKQIGWTLSQKKYPADMRFYAEHYHRNLKLLLTPLSQITDEHASEIVKVLRIQEDEAGFDTNGAAIKNCLIQDGFYALDLFAFYSGVSDVFQYLLSKGYAVPLWLGIGHWANGKTAIELGIAIDKTTHS